MKYIININGRDYNVEYDESSASTVRLNGEEMTFDMRQGIHPQNVSLILDNHSLMFWIEKNEEGYHAHCHGRDFKISVEDEKTRHLKSILKASGDRSVVGTIKASMPGMVVKILAKLGKHVQKGQGLLIVEAMKMENEIKSPVDGTVKQIRVEPLRAVEKGEVLMILEPANSGTSK
jgi:biotin carboxyl carrier protein